MPDEVVTQHFNRAVTAEDITDLFAEIDSIDSPAEHASAPAAPAPTRVFPPALKALILAKAAELKADAYANGWTAQAWRAIDAWRVANAQDYNEKRRHEYAIAKLAKTGSLPRSYRKAPTPADRAKQLAGAQQTRRKDMTQEQREAESAKRQARRLKAEQGKRPEDHPNFGRF